MDNQHYQRQNSGFSTLLIVFFIAVIGTGIIGYISYGETEDTGDTDKSTTTQSAPETSTTTVSNTDDTTPASWQMYRSEKYGFSIQYPGYYKKPRNESLDTNALIKLEAESYPTIKISAYPIQEYYFSSGPGGGWPIYYDTGLSQWERRAGSEVRPYKDAQHFQTQESKVYVFEGGVVPERWQVYAIPLEEKDIMVEVRFFYNTVKESDGFTTSQVDERGIVSSFEFIR